MKHDNKLPYCNGCRNDYYNHGGHSTSGRCWSLPTAKIVTRFRIGWWTQPTAPGAFHKVKTLSCHHATGSYAHYEKLPDCVTLEERKRINGRLKSSYLTNTAKATR